MKNLKKLLRSSSLSSHNMPMLRKASQATGAGKIDRELEKKFLEGRPYQNNTTGELISKLLINSIVQRNYFAENSEKLLLLAQSILGRRISEYLIEQTFGKMFTGGPTHEAVKQTIAKYNQQGIPVFVGFLAEAAKTQIPTDEEMDQYAQDFLESVLIAAQKADNGMSIKVSALGNYDLIKKANKAQETLLQVFDEAGKNSNSTTEVKIQEIYNVMKAKRPELEPRVFLEFVKQFYNLDVESLNNHQAISKFDWKLHTHAYDISSESKTRNALIQMFAGYGEKDYKDLAAFKCRLEKILFPALEKRVEVLCDAEQSYLQAFIDSIAEQYSVKYNNSTEKPLVANTIQNYLKNSTDKIKFEVDKCQKLKMPFCLKMVRGAYMVEERRIAKEKGTESPVHDNIEATHNSYNSNIEYLISKLGNNSRVYVCGHNQESIFRAMELVEKKGVDKKNCGVKFAQLIGFGEHLTHHLHRSGFHVIKYMTYGPTHIMFPFLGRRAQECKQMIESTKFQRKLLKDELKKRMIGNKSQ